MTDIKLLTGIKMSLQNALVDIKNLNDCINKHCWQDIVEDLIKDINESIKIEKLKDIAKSVL
jgi:hypothetical protein